MKKIYTLLFILLNPYFSFLYAQVTFTSSKLPIVMVKQLGSTLSSSPIITHLSIINNSTGLNFVTNPPNDVVSYASMNVRGSTSSGFPQKSYSIELRDSINNTLAIKKKVLGMPSESDWILYGPYTDKTFIRNVLTFTLGAEMGEYSPRGKFVELVIDSAYQGVYVLFEKIKRDNNRVNISKMLPTDITYPNVTGGYILKIDKFTGTFLGGFGSSISNFQNQPQSYFFQIDYPKTIVTNQLTYIQNYVDSFENTLLDSNFRDPINGYKKFINVNSFINYFLSNEVSNNVDGYRLSTYLYKKRIGSGDGKIHMGPLWDFNLAYGNADYCDGWRNDAWAYEQPCSQSDIPFWWRRLLQDTTYANQLKCRYTFLRNTSLSNSRIEFLIDSMVNYVGVDATNRHYQQWPILGTYVWPNFYVGATYSEEIDSIKSWVNQRMAWLDANMPGIIPIGCLQAPFAINNIKLTANNTVNNIQLSWDTPEQITANKFLIERSTDAYHFTKIGELKKQDLSNKNLSFTDYQPLLGTNYYRIRYKNDDGSYTESNIVYIIYKNNKAVQLYPTVVDDYLNVLVNYPKATIMQIAIYDLYGTKILSTLETLQINNRVKVPTTNLQSGQYFIKIKINNTYIETLKFIKS